MNSIPDILYESIYIKFLEFNIYKLEYNVKDIIFKNDKFYKNKKINIFIENYIKDIIQNNNIEEYNKYFKNIIFKKNRNFINIYEKILIEELYKIVCIEEERYEIFDKIKEWIELYDKLVVENNYINKIYIIKQRIIYNSIKYNDTIMFEKCIESFKDLNIKDYVNLTVIKQNTIMLNIYFDKVLNENINDNSKLEEFVNILEFAKRVNKNCILKWGYKKTKEEYKIRKFFQNKNKVHRITCYNEFIKLI
jgi:hypothetical protein